MAGLHTYGKGTTNFPRGKVPSDSQIEKADAIIVEYRSRKTGQSAFRTIHGAPDLETIGDLITDTLREASPVNRKRK